VRFGIVDIVCLLLSFRCPALRLERGDEIGEERLPEVFRAEDGPAFRDAPVYAEGGIQQGDAAVRPGGVEGVALVLEDGLGAEHREPVGESAGDEHLPVVFAAELDRDVLPVGGAAAADVHCDVEHRPSHDPHQFRLGEGRGLEMETADDAVNGEALVVLHEADRGGERFIEVPLIPGFEEVAAGVPEDAGFYHKNAFQCGWDDVHIFLWLPEPHIKS